MTDAENGPEPKIEGEGPDEAKEKAGQLKALEAERHKRQALEDKVEGLEATVQGLTTPQKGEDEKELTSAELRQAVTEGKLSDAEADDIKDRQRERRADQQIKKTVEDTIAVRDVFNKVADEVGRYLVAVPDLEDRESPSYQRLRGEFSKLVALGYDAKDKRTELLAAKMAFGDIERLESVSGPEDRETHQDVGGSGSGQDKPDVKDGWPKDTNAGQKRYYEDLISKGMKTKKQAVEELEYHSKKIAQRQAKQQRTA